MGLVFLWCPVFREAFYRGDGVLDEVDSPWVGENVVGIGLSSAEEAVVLALGHSYGIRV